MLNPVPKILLQSVHYGVQQVSAGTSVRIGVTVPQKLQQQRQVAKKQWRMRQYVRVRQLGFLVQRQCNQ